MVTDGAAAHQPLERAADPHLQGGVDGAGGLVEDQQVGVGEVGAEQRDQLPLAGRQRLAALADPGVEPARQAGDPVAEAELVGAGEDVGRRWRRAGRSGRWRPGCRRRGSPPAAPAPRCGAATPGRCRGRRPRRAAPRPRLGSISRVSSLANVDLPEPVSPTIATRVPAAMSMVDVAQHRRPAGVGERDVVEPDVDRAARQDLRRPARGRPGRPGCRGCRSPGASRRWRSGRR